jgi:4'-phosphopantetheinyl transferase
MIDTGFSDDEVHVSYVLPEPVVSAALRAEYEALLSDDERARSAQFVFGADRWRYIVAHALVRITLSRYAAVPPQAWTFEATASGRPEICGPAGVSPLRFSLSHTRGLIAVAVTRRADVGVDAERIDPSADMTALARQFFAPAEVQMLEAATHDRRAHAFFELWTLKEAYVKALGVGLSLPLNSFAIAFGAPPTIAFADGADAVTCHFAQLDLSPCHAAAVAVRGERPPRVVLRRFLPGPA